MNIEKHIEEQLKIAIDQSQKLISDNGEIKKSKEENTWDDSRPYTSLNYDSQNYSLSNNIVFGVQPMTLLETKLLRIILASANDNNVTITGFKPFKMRVSELADMLDIKSKTSAYDSLYKAAWSLSKRQLFIETDSVWTAFNWFEYVAFPKNGHGEIIMQLSGGLRTFLTDLKRNFSVFPLPLLLSFHKKHSIHLYEGIIAKIRRDKKMSQAYSRGEIVIVAFGIEEIKRITATLNRYKKINDFKRIVIDPAIKEISKLTDFMIQKYETERVASSSINLFRFFIQKKNFIEANNNSGQLKIPIKKFQDSSKFSVEYIQEIFDINDCSYTKENIPYLIKHYTKDTFLRDFKKAQKHSTSDITNYMVSMIENEKNNTADLNATEEKQFDKLFNYWNDSCIEHEAKKEAHVRPVKYKTKSAKKKFKQLLEEGISFNEIMDAVELANNSAFFIDNRHTFSYFLIPENFKRVVNEDEYTTS